MPATCSANWRSMIGQRISVRPWRSVNVRNSSSEAAVDLQARDLQSDVVVAQLKAALESAEVAVTRAQLAVDRTQVVAPFDGVVEQRSVEVGDLLNVGSVCACTG